MYQRSERAVRYGLLFIGLTFGAFFLFETLKRWRMHPLQYAFVGLALALLYGVLYALLLGSLLLFALLATAMWLTRRVDWYTAHAAQQQ